MQRMQTSETAPPSQELYSSFVRDLEPKEINSDETTTAPEKTVLVATSSTQAWTCDICRLGPPALLAMRAVPPVCQHMFHSRCLRQWIRTRQRQGHQPNCPSCRLTFSVQTKTHKLSPKRLLREYDESCLALLGPLAEAIHQLEQGHGLIYERVVNEFQAGHVRVVLAENVPIPSCVAENVYETLLNYQQDPHGLGPLSSTNQRYERGVCIAAKKIKDRFQNHVALFTTPPVVFELDQPLTVIPQDFKFYLRLHVRGVQVSQGRRRANLAVVVDDSDEDDDRSHHSSDA